jgi:hypothetical protein
VSWRKVVVVVGRQGSGKNSGKWKVLRQGLMTDILEGRVVGTQLILFGYLVTELRKEWIVTDLGEICDIMRKISEM